MHSSNVVAIISSPADLTRCAGTLSKFAEKHQVNILVVRGRIPKKTHGIDVHKIHEIREFDYGAVTQGNVNALRAVIEKLEPSLAIIPSIKTLDARLGVLAGSALLACRSIASILMYDRSRSDSGHSVFSIKADSKNKQANQNGGKRARLGKPMMESFESQRIILLGDVFR